MQVCLSKLAMLMRVGLTAIQTAHACAGFRRIQWYGEAMLHALDGSKTDERCRQENSWRDWQFVLL